MKKLYLMLFLVTTLAWGQGKINIGKYSYHFDGINDSTPKYLTVVGKDSMRSPAPYSAMVLITILQSYDAYAKECYADSSKSIEHITNGTSCVRFSYGEGDFKCEALGHYDKQIWIHRQPTLEGFINYLRAKIR